jgi:DNA-binding protein H-NS
MKRQKLTSLSLDDLIALRDSVGGLISRKAIAARKELQEKLDLLTGFGGGTRDRKYGRGSKLKGRKVPAKYRNPRKRSETWAGRGAMPLWLRAQIKAGKKLEHFAIKRGRPKKAA